MNCARMSSMGSAGFKGGVGEYRHMTINFWSQHGDGDGHDTVHQWCVEMLTEFADVCAAIAARGRDK